MKDLIEEVLGAKRIGDKLSKSIDGEEYTLEQLITALSYVLSMSVSMICKEEGENPNPDLAEAACGKFTEITMNFFRSL